MKLGKLPARKDAIKFKLNDYIDLSKLPKPPKTFGHENLVDPTGWLMLGNNEYGDCLWAGAAHETRMWNLEAGNSVDFTDASVLSDYSAVTGFKPSDPSTDQGTDMQVAANYRRKTGVLDAHGNRHKVAAYLALKPGDVTELYIAMYLFGAVGIGLEFPASGMDQFNAGKPWSVVKGASIEGGHYVPLVARRKSLECITWGKAQALTVGFLEKYNDESIVYISDEALTNNKSPEGFNAMQLQTDLEKL